jgi:hypothetical protein
MTTITETAALPQQRPMNRIVAVTRLHFVNRFSMLVLPVMILGFILIINAAIWYSVLIALGSGHDSHDAQKGFSYTGAVFYIFIYMLVVAVQAMSRTFPFALGYGVTRRNFYLGSALSFVLLALIYSALLTILSVIELATNGWGAGGHMFTPTYFTSQSWGIRFLMYFFLFLFFLFLGSAVASVYVRWKTTGMVVFFGILALLLVGAVVIITLGQSWVAVADWFATTGAFGCTAWLLVPTVIAAVAGYFVLQRATPKN